MTIVMIVIMTVTHSITASTTGVRVWTIHAHSESVLKIAGVRAVMVRVVAGVKVAMVNPAAVVADPAAITDVAATVAVATVVAVTVAAAENPRDTIVNHLREEVVKAVARVIGAAAGRTNATTTGAKAGTAATDAQAPNVVTAKACAITLNNATTIQPGFARMSRTVAAVMTTIAIGTTAEKIAAGGIVLRTRWRRGLVMKTPSAGVARTSSVNIAGVDPRTTAVRTSASRRMLTID